MNNDPSSLHSDRIVILSRLCDTQYECSHEAFPQNRKRGNCLYWDNAAVELAWMERQWKWKWAGLPWKRTEGLDYYDAVVQIDPTNRFPSRTLRRGDPVCVNGDDGYERSALWIAQILDFIQVNDDAMLADVELEPEHDPIQKKYTRMRCTLRWFYSETDVDSDALAKGGLPEPCVKEYYFTDDIEVPGYNDLQAIEGRAWPVNTEDERARFMETPDDMYIPTCDTVCIVRGYISSQLGIARRLCRGELRRLLKTTSTEPMFLSSFEEITGRPFDTSRRDNPRITNGVSDQQPDGQSPASMVAANVDRKPTEPLNSAVNFDEHSDDPDFDADKSGFESNTEGGLGELRNRRISKKRAKSDKKTDAMDISAESGSEEADAIDAAERAKFRLKYTHTGRHRVRFNKDERDDGSDYENDIEARDRRSRPGVQDRVPRSSDRKEYGDDHRRRHRLSRDSSGVRAGGVADASRRANGSSIRSSKSSLRGRPKKTSRSPSHESTTRPSRPGENHLSMFRSLESAKKRDAPVIIVGDLKEDGKGSAARPRSSNSRSVRDHTGEEDVALSTHSSQSPKSRVRIGSSSRKSVEVLRDDKLTQKKQGSAKIRSLQPKNKRTGTETTDSDDNGNTVAESRNSSNSSGRRKAMLSGHKSSGSPNSVRDRDRESKVYGKSKRESNRMDIDHSTGHPIKVGRKRILDEDDSSGDDSSADESAENIVICQTELKQMFESLSGRGKKLVMQNTKMVVDETLRMVDIKTAQGKHSLGEMMVEEIAQDVAKKLTFTARR